MGQPSAAAEAGPRGHRLIAGAAAHFLSESCRAKVQASSGMPNLANSCISFDSGLTWCRREISRRPAAAACSPWYTW